MIKPIVDLQEAMEEANRTISVSAKTISNLARMLDVAMKVMLNVAQDKETPLPIIQKMVAALQGIRAIGLPYE